MLSPSSVSPFSAVPVVEEDPIVKAAKAAAEAAQGHLPSDETRKATLSTTPLQPPPQHVTRDSSSASTHSLHDTDAVIVDSTPAAAQNGDAHGSSSSASSPAVFDPGSLPGIAPRSKYKLVFLGNESTGKTSIISRFMYNGFDSYYKVTIGIDFVSRSLQHAGRTVRLQLWDTAGQERFRSLIPSYIRDATVAVLTYDITSRHSFAAISRWLDDVRRDRGSDVLLVLVGNKLDLEAEGGRQVTREEGRAYAKSIGAIFSEVSAKSGANVSAMMAAVVSYLPGEGEGKERVEGFGSEKAAAGAGKGGSQDIRLTAADSSSAQSSAAACAC